MNLPLRSFLSSRPVLAAAVILLATLGTIALAPAETHADPKECFLVNYYNASGTLIGQSGSCCNDCSFRCRWGQSSLTYWSQGPGCI